MNNIWSLLIVVFIILLLYLMLGRNTNTPVLLNDSAIPAVSLTVIDYNRLTGDPLKDTPLLFKQGDVVLLKSLASQKYLNIVPEDRAVEGPDVTIEFDTVVEATGLKESHSSQWIVTPPDDPQQFPSSVRLRNVEYPQLYLKGFALEHPISSHLPQSGWQPGLGQTPRSNIYATSYSLFNPQSALVPPAAVNTIVVYSGYLGHRYSKVDRQSDVFLAAYQDGSIISPLKPSTDVQIQWLLEIVGKQNVDGSISYQ